MPVITAIKAKIKEFLRINFKIDVSKKVVNNIIVFNSGSIQQAPRIDDKGDVLIDLGDLNDNQLKKLNELLLEMHNEGSDFLRKDLAEYSNQIDRFKPSLKDEEILKELEGKIPPLDYEALKVSLVLRYLYVRKKDINKLKLDILKKFGERGGNISNLCSAGYFERFIIPMFKSLTSYFKDDAKDMFDNIYELIVGTQLLAVFVNRDMNAEKLNSLIRERYDQARKYGFDILSQYLYIHAIGRENVKTVEAWLTRIKLEKSFNVEIVSQIPNFITVRISFPKRESV